MKCIKIVSATGGWFITVNGCGNRDNVFVTADTDYALAILKEEMRAIEKKE